MFALARVVHSVITRGSSGLFNDFYDYWAAATLLNRGQNPYDIGALRALERAAGLQSETGSGYSYPLLFAHLMRPLTGAVTLVKPRLSRAVSRAAAVLPTAASASSLSPTVLS